MTTVSLITITYNNPGIAITLQSVLSQSLDPSKIEHIIVDNLSSDDTQSIVEAYQQKSPYKVTYIREADTGRYNAMNKGIKAATGEYLLFLNAGDCLHDPSVLSQVFSQNYQEDILYGDVCMIEDNDHHKVWSLKGLPLDRQFFVDRTIFHQSAFIKKQLFEKYGLYDDSLKIVADFEFFIRTIIRHHVSTRYLPFVISNYDTHGISSTMSDYFLAERASVIMRHYQGKTYFYHLLKYTYYKSKQYFPQFLINYQQKHLLSKPKI